MIETPSEKKKNLEQRYLERFQRLFLDFPSGEIESTEEPDFLIYRSKSILGIELTELHRDNLSGNRPEQANEAMVNRVVARAKQVYESRQAPAIYVTVFFYPKAIIKKLDVETLAQSIVDIAIRNFPNIDTSIEEKYEWTNRDYFPEEIYMVRVNRMNYLTETIFNAPMSSWVHQFTTADIERVLEAKEQKCLSYRKKCAEVWLIINSDVRSMSTWFQYDSIPSISTCKTSFDRVFILRHFPNTFYELEVQKNLTFS